MRVYILVLLLLAVPAVAQDSAYFSSTTGELHLPQVEIDGSTVFSPVDLLLDFTTGRFSLHKAQPADAMTLAAQRYQRIPCPLAASIVSEDLECGLLRVPEDRIRPQGRYVQIAVSVRRQGDSAKPPLFVLSGGPGGSGLYEASWVEPPFNDRDVIMLDQRGAGFAIPALKCPEQNESSLSHSAGQKLCRDRLERSGLDLAAFNSTESAADINDLRLALGYERIYLLGQSYGTYLALIIMREYPEILAGVILDSVLPPQATILGDAAGTFWRPLSTLFQDCAQEPACMSAYPDLEDRFTQALAEFPVFLRESGGSGESITLFEEDFLFVVERLLAYSLGTELPSLINDVAQGDYTALTGLLVWLTEAGPEASEVADGMYMAITCRELLSKETYAEAIANYADYPQWLQNYVAQYTDFILTSCALWDLPPASADASQPVHSAVPTLLLAGSYDTLTNSLWAEQAAETLSRSTLAVFPRLGHGISYEHTCPQNIMRDFLDKPAQTPDLSCIDSLAADYPYFTRARAVRRALDKHPRRFVPDLKYRPN